MGPLTGLRVIDMTTVVMGPYATQTLGDYGADVIKIEAPSGDVFRQAGAKRHAGMGAQFLAINRSKRSITLDVKKPEARDVVLRMCESADILIYNLRPSSMSRLGVSYADVTRHNPRIIYVGAFGYGQDGPYADNPAYDDLIQGAALLPYLMQQSGSSAPRYVPLSMCDRVVGLFLVSAILTGVIERTRSGKGQRIDVPMFESMVSFVLSDQIGGLLFEPPLDDGGYARNLTPSRRPFRTKDGYLCALPYTDAHWRRLLGAIGRMDIMESDLCFATYATRLEHIGHVYDVLAGILENRSTDEWLNIFNQADVPAMPMHDFDSLFQDPHLRTTQFFGTTIHPTEGRMRHLKVPVQFYRTPAEPERSAPTQGEHGHELLREFGYVSEEITALRDAGAWVPGARAS
ncbi:MAG: CaiB/BaiF CoA transferase family protein [Rhodanobacteraceae bacterium]